MHKTVKCGHLLYCRCLRWMQYHWVTCRMAVLCSTEAWCRTSLTLTSTSRCTTLALGGMASMWVALYVWQGKEGDSNMYSGGGTLWYVLRHHPTASESTKWVVGWEVVVCWLSIGELGSPIQCHGRQTNPLLCTHTCRNTVGQANILLTWCVQQNLCHFCISHCSAWVYS